MAGKAKKVAVKRTGGKAPAESASGYNPVDAVRRDMHALMETLNRGWSNLADLEFRGMGAPFGLWTAESVPRADASEADGAYDISIELPGMDEKDIEVNLAGDMLTVSGEKKSEHEEKAEGYYLAERSYGSFRRAFRLPDDADAEKIKAEYAKGVLKLSIPKAAKASAKTRKIGVKAA
jgi:HSP20 family protein